MTNIQPHQTMKNLQKIAHPTYHSVVLWNNRVDKDYWQKVWMIERFVQELGFVKVDKK